MAKNKNKTPIAATTTTTTWTAIDCWICRMSEIHEIHLSCGAIWNLIIDIPATTFSKLLGSTMCVSFENRKYCRVISLLTFAFVVVLSYFSLFSINVTHYLFIKFKGKRTPFAASLHTKRPLCPLLEWQRKQFTCYMHAFRYAHTHVHPFISLEKLLAQLC